MRSIRRLDGHRATPFVFKFLRFAKEKDIDAYNFPEESISTPDLSESEYGDESTISREWIPSPILVPEFEDSDIQIISQNDASELEDKEVRRKPQQWIEYPKPEEFEVCTTPLQQSTLDVDDEAFGPEPRPLSPVHQSDPEFDDNLKDDGPLEANNSEPREFFAIDECDEDFDNEKQNEEPTETHSPEPREPFTIDECDEELDDEQQNEEPIEANSPEPQHPSPVRQSPADFDDDKNYDEPLEAGGPEPQLVPFRDEFPFLEYGDTEKDDDSLEADSPEPRRLFPVHRSHSALNEPLHPDAQSETFCLAPLRRFLTPETILQHDLFEEWFVYMSEHAFMDASLETPISETPSPEPRRLFPLRQESPVPQYDYGEAEYEESRASPQFHSPLYDYPQSALQPEIFCPKPIRKHPTHKVIIQPELFEDWHVDMSEPVFIGEETVPKPISSETPSPDQRKYFPVRHDSPYQGFDDGEMDDEALERFEFIPLECLNLRF